jgi:hypothetical protein
MQELCSTRESCCFGISYSEFKLLTLGQIHEHYREAQKFWQPLRDKASRQGK